MKDISVTHDYTLVIIIIVLTASSLEQGSYGTFTSDKIYRSNPAPSSINKKNILSWNPIYKRYSTFFQLFFIFARIHKYYASNENVDFFISFSVRLIFHRTIDAVELECDSDMDFVSKWRIKYLKTSWDLCHQFSYREHLYIDSRSKRKLKNPPIDRRCVDQVSK